MSYILTSVERTTLESDGLQFTFKSGGKDIVFDEGLHTVLYSATGEQYSW